MADSPNYKMQGRSSLGQQLIALLKKNILLKKRNKKQTFQEILFPIYFILILVMIRSLSKPSLQPSVNSFAIHELNNSQFQLNKNILYVCPDTVQIRQVMSYTQDLLTKNNIHASGVYVSEIVYFNDNSSLLDAYQQNPDNVSAGIEFSDGSLSEKKYIIRMAADVVPSTEMVGEYVSQDQCRDPSGFQHWNCEAQKYLFSGFANLQSAINTAILKVVSLESDFPVPEISIQQFPKADHTPDVSYIQTLSAIYFVMAYSPFINFLCVNLVTEKEKKIKEGMRMMGMRDSAFWLAWGLVYTVIMSVVTLIVVAIAAYSKFMPNSNPVLFFLTLFLYSLTIITMSFAITPFFNKAEAAGGLASLASMVFSLLYLPVSLSRTMGPTGPVSSIPVWGQWLMSLLSPVALALSLDQAVYLDVAQGGMKFSNMNVGQFPLYASFTMLLVDFILYGLLAIYFDNVIPGEYGQRKSPYFFLLPAYWCPKKNPQSDEERLMKGVSAGYSQHSYGTTQPNLDCMEPVSSDIANKNVVRLYNIAKTYPSGSKPVHAVKGISMDIYEGHITAILGHNGAGKTTLLNMLSGLSPPSHGSATIYGLDVADTNDMNEIRSMTGVCPQHDILLDDLSCAEHLHVFASLKGVSSDRIKQEAERALRDVDLTDQIDTFARDLSGGQKRKLSVAIALIGDPKVLFLDEPTAGMDPYSRRRLWSLLKEKRPGRVILLTTHFMDEADILADRKAFISKGKLRCVGSSLFLKNKFGVGYHLGMVIDEADKQNEITSFVLNHIPNAQQVRSHGKELTYTLPLEAVGNFSDLFESLSSENASENMGIKSYGVSMTSLEEVFLKIGEEDEMDDIDLENANKDIDDNPEDPLINNTSELDQLCQDKLEGRALTIRRYQALVKFWLLSMLRHPSVLFYRIIMPMIFMVIGAVISMYSSNSGTDVNKEFPVLPLSPLLYLGPSTCQDQCLPDLLRKYAPGGPGKDMFEKALVKQGISMANWNSDLSEDAPHYIALDTARINQIGKLITSRIRAVYNDTAVHSLPVAIDIISNALLEMVAPGDQIQASSQPFPSKSQTRVIFDNGSFMLILFVGMGLCTIPGSFGILVVKVRQTKIRSLFRISGLTQDLFWGSLFLVDGISFFCVAVLALVILLAFQVKSVLFAGAIVSIILLFVTYVVCLTLFSYLFSFLFSKKETCQNVQPVAFMFLSFLPYLAVSILDMMGVTAATIVHYIVLVLNPGYAVFGGLYYIGKVYTTSVVAGTTDQITFLDYFKMDSHIPGTYILLILHTIWVYFALRAADVRSTGGDVRDVFPCCGPKTGSATDLHAPDDVPANEDEDITRERERVDSWNPTSQENVPVIVTKNVRKEFSKRSSKRSSKKKKVPTATLR